MLLSALLALTSPALAVDAALDPQNRVHFGVNLVTGPSPVGFTGGWDARLTRVVNIDVGGFVSPFAIGESKAMPDVEFTDAFALRHGVYVAAGLRVPHPQPKSWAWDVFGRAGGGVLWAANLDPDAPAFEPANYAVNFQPGGTVGGDLLIRSGRTGVRALGRAWIFNETQTSPSQSFAVVRPQFALEGFWQW